MTMRAGFTLVELVAVITIIAIIASALAVAVSGSSHQRLQEEAAELQSVLQLAADEAMFEGTQVSVLLNKDTYGFLRYDNASGSWRPFSERVFNTVRLPENLLLSLTIENTAVKFSETDKKNQPESAVFFLSDGEMTPFSLTLMSGNDDKDAFTLSTDGINPITLKAKSHAQ